MEKKARQWCYRGNKLNPSKFNKEGQNQFIIKTADISPLRITQKFNLPYYSPAYHASTPLSSALANFPKHATSSPTSDPTSLSPCSSLASRLRSASRLAMAWTPASSLFLYILPPFVPTSSGCWATHCCSSSGRIQVRYVQPQPQPSHLGNRVGRRPEYGRRVAWELEFRWRLCILSRWIGWRSTCLLTGVLCEREVDADDLNKIACDGLYWCAGK